METERKFLVDKNNNSWKSKVLSVQKIVQGYFSSCSPIVRVRIFDDSYACLTIKNCAVGPNREEFEYSIPLPDAKEMLERFCGERIIRKTRYAIKGDWIIDEYESPRLLHHIAEIELRNDVDNFVKPDWLGEEITDCIEYSNFALAIDNERKGEE